MFCPNCGAEVNEGGAFCPACGKPLTNTPAPEIVPTIEEDVASLSDRQTLNIMKLISVICYLDFGFLIPIFMLKDKKYLRSHANNGLVLTIFSVGAASLSWIPVLGWITVGVIGTFCTVLAIIGIVNSIKGKAYKMPIIGGIKIIK